MHLNKPANELLSRISKIHKRNKIYNNLKVEAKFGTGRASAVPWISFLSEYDSVQDGIYPVYLYYKEKNILVLAYELAKLNLLLFLGILQINKRLMSIFISIILVKLKNMGVLLFLRCMTLNRH